jgi:hypothetical protein
LLPHQHGQCADVILMRVRDENGNDRAIVDWPPLGKSILALVIWVHPAIENEASAIRFEKITVGADFGPARQINELHLACWGSKLATVLNGGWKSSRVARVLPEEWA